MERIRIECNDELSAQIREIAERDDVCQNDVIDQAFTLFIALSAEIAKGNRIVVLDAENTVVFYVEDSIRHPPKLE